MTNPDSYAQDPSYIPSELADAEEPAQKRSAAFIADPDAPGFLVKETVSDLIARHRIDHALVDTKTRAGIQAGLALLDAGIPYRIAAMLTEVEENEAPQLGEQSRELASKVARGAYDDYVLDRDDIDLENQLAVLLPRVVMGGSLTIGVSPDRIVGATLALIQNGQRECMLVWPPEFGLVPESSSPDTDYLLRTAILKD